MEYKMTTLLTPHRHKHPISIPHDIKKANKTLTKDFKKAQNFLKGKSNWNSLDIAETLDKTGNFFKGTDGWDELGSGIGQTLPGIGQHIATLSVLSILTPFVYLGVKGMASEMDEAKEDLHEIQNTKEKLLKKINDIFGLKISTEFFKNRINNIKDIAEILKNHVTDEDFEAKAELFAQYAHNLVEEKTAKIANSATPYGLAGMTGMLGGMVVANLRSGAEIASTAQPTIQALEIVALALEIATAGMFMPAQIAMMIYAGKIVEQGKVIRKKLNHDKKAMELLKPDAIILKEMKKKLISFEKEALAELEKASLHPEESFEDAKETLQNSHLKISEDFYTGIILKEMKEKLTAEEKAVLAQLGQPPIHEEENFKDAPETLQNPPLNISENFYNAIQDNLDRKLYYNKLGKIIYGRGLAISEAGMVVGGILGFIPLAQIAAPAVLVPSAVSTIGCASLRIYAQKQEGKFTGDIHDHIHDGSISHAWKDTFKGIGKGIKNKLFRKKDTDHHEHHHHEHNHHHHHDHGKTYIHDSHKTHEEEFNNSTKELAKQKLNSLALYALSSDNPQEKLKKMVKTGKKSFFKGTTLQKDVIAEMQDIYKNESEWYNNNLTKIGIPKAVAEQIPSNQDIPECLIDRMACAKDLRKFLANLLDISLKTDLEQNIAIKKLIENIINKKFKIDDEKQPLYDKDLLNKKLSEEINQKLEDILNNRKILKRLCKGAISYKKRDAKQKRQGVINEVVFQANVKSLQAKAENLFTHPH